MITVRILLEALGFEGDDLDDKLRWALIELKLRRDMDSHSKRKGKR